MFKIFSLAFFLGVSVFAHALTPPSDITDQLAHIDGLTFKEMTSSVSGYRVFDIQYKQPEDHHHLEGAWFAQRLILWHRDAAAAPMILQTSGYAIMGIALSALASEFNANQIQVEHRFFAGSIPADKDWSLDTIEQSANDFHRITVAFKNIYSGRWVNTGRSKGGMTSVYHRRFFPTDLDGTVAHVAPLSFSVEDKRFADFVADRIGGASNAACRENLLATQRLLLQHKAELADRLTGEFNQLGSKDIAVEHSIIEMPWSYWQYNGPATTPCATIPTATSTFASAQTFLEKINSPTGYNDEELAGFVPYYYQAATQLGNPGTRLSSILDLLDHPETFSIFTYVPKGITAHYDDAEAMQDIAEWVAGSSQRMLFVYGEYDPWGAGPFSPREDSDSYEYYVPKTNHSAQFIDLKGNDRTVAYARLQNWLGVAATNSDNKARTAAKTLEQIEFETIRERH